MSSRVVGADSPSPSFWERRGGAEGGFWGAGPRGGGGGVGFSPSPGDSPVRPGTRAAGGGGEGPSAGAETPPRTPVHEVGGAGVRASSERRRRRRGVSMILTGFSRRPGRGALSAKSRLPP